MIAVLDLDRPHRPAIAGSPKMNNYPAFPAWCSRWANRFLILSLIGIVYFTLFPFRFDFGAALPENRSPFLLGPSWKYRSFLDFFLNFLLFVPFGFGLAAESRKRSRNWATGALLAFAGGCFVSYTIEFLQLYIPSRNSGWDDVFSNTLGSVGGFLLLEFCGAAIFRRLSFIEDALENWMSLERAAVVLLIYLGAWFAVSIPLQHETRLSNWDDRCPLIIGNDSSGQRPWTGEISRVQVWDRALTEEGVTQLTSRDGKADPDSDLLAAFEFPASARFTANKGTSPVFFWQTGEPLVEDSVPLRLESKSWLTTKMPVKDLVDRIGQTSQFTLRVTCSPANISQSAGQIVSLSKSDDETDLGLRQTGSALGFWFRNPLSMDRSALTWNIPGVFSALNTVDIVVTYDGSDAVVYLNGKRLPERYRLSAGASLAHRFTFVRTAYLPGYEVLYSTFIFLPVGMLVGFAGRNLAGGKAFRRFLLALFLVALPILLEFHLAWLGHRGISLHSLLVSLLLACVGVLFINADRRGSARSDYSGICP